MKKFSALVSILFLLISGNVLACSDIFINQPLGHIEARTMDFGVNIGNKSAFGYVGQKNTTDIIIDADKIPEKDLASWTVRYGYWGRSAFDTPKILDGMNVEGLTFSVLYLTSMTKYPTYNPADNRPVLAAYDAGSYLLGSCKNVGQAVALLKKTQLVQSAVEYGKGVFVKDIPLHFVLRDATGHSAVVEFTNGVTKIYENAGNVLTNEPTYPEQLELAKKYEQLTAKSTDGTMFAMPGGYTSEERYARAFILTRNLPQPFSHQEALYQADNVIMSLTRPYLANNGGYNSCTIWTLIKDLDNKVVYEKNNLFYQGGKTIFPQSIKNGYSEIDLKAVNWKVAPQETAGFVTRPTPKDKVLKMLVASDIF